MEFLARVGGHGYYDSEFDFAEDAAGHEIHERDVRDGEHGAVDRMDGWSEDHD